MSNPSLGSLEFAKPIDKITDLIKGFMLLASLPTNKSHLQLDKTECTGVKVFIGSKVQCLFCLETSTTEGRGEELGGGAKFQAKAHRTFDPRNNSTPV